MPRPQIVRVRPDDLRDVEEVSSPKMEALLDKGWTVATVVILEDPRQPEGEQHRITFILTPPSGVVASPSSWPLSWVVLGLCALAAVGGALLVSLVL